MLKNFNRIEFEPGQIIIGQGEKGDHLAYIRDGRVEVVREVNGREEFVAELGQGDIIGEMSLITGEPRSASVRAIEKTSIFQINQRLFQYSLINEDLPILREIMIQLVKRLQRSEEKNGTYRSRIAALEEQLAQQGR